MIYTFVKEFHFELFTMCLLFVAPYFYYIALRRHNWFLYTGTFLLFVINVLGTSLDIYGKPRVDIVRSNLRVVSVYAERGNAIYVLVRAENEEEPVYIKLPWSLKTMQEITRAREEARKRGTGGVIMEREKNKQGTPTGKFRFYSSNNTNTRKKSEF